VTNRSGSSQPNGVLMLLGFALGVVQWVALIAAVDQRDYTQLIGRPSRICGRVVTYSVEKGCDVRLDLGSPYWKPALYIVVPANARTEFTPLPEDAFLFQDICVTGLVEADEKGVPHIATKNPTQFEVTTKRKLEPFGAGTHRVCGRVAGPKLVKEVQPNYSAEGIARNIQGLVLLDAVVGIDGKVTDQRVVFGLLDSLDHEAREAVKKWRFKPGALDGTPVPTIVAIEMSFTLKK
jgi:TonB family protein